MAKSFDYREFEELLTSVKEIQKNYNSFLYSFLMEMGLRAIAQTKKLTPVDTGHLRNTWELSQVYRRGDELYVVLFNPTEYASFVEDGHMQHKRFVPGRWVDNRFEYIPNHPTGMMLKNMWVPGDHMARISITKVELELPQRFNKAFKKFVSGLEGI